VTNFLDSSIGFKKQVDYVTPIVVDRFLEFTGGAFKLDKASKQGEGLRVGSRLARSARRVVPFSSITGDIELEACTKGLGTFWELCMGAGASTLVSAGLYQQVFTFADTLPAATIQEGIWDGSAVAAYTYDGCQVGSFSIEAAEGDIVKLKASIVGRALATATAYATPSYVASNGLFTFAHAAFYAGGTLTAPTTTVLGSASGTALAIVKSLTINVDNQLKDGPQIAGLPTERKPGLRTVTASATVEYSGSTFRDAIIAETEMLMLATFTNGTDVLQVIIPATKLDGELPAPTTNERITQSISFVGLDNLTAAQGLWIVTRTADAAL
jgi:hypothetical protein